MLLYVLMLCTCSSAVGRFIADACHSFTNSDAYAQSAVGGLFRVYSDGAGSQSCMADQAVYSRMRCFRLLLSCKNTGYTSAASTTAPVLTVDNCNQLRATPNDLQHLFFKSLICNIQTPLSQLRILTYGEDSTAASSTTTQQPTQPRHASTRPSSSSGFSAQSPFPALYSYISSYASQGVVQGYVRSWAYFRGEEDEHADSEQHSSDHTSDTPAKRAKADVSGHKTHTICFNMGKLPR